MRSRQQRSRKSSACTRRASDYAQAVIQYNLGMQDLGKGDLNAAREAFQTALARWPSLAQAHTNLGGVLLKLGDAKGAAGHLRTAVDMNPDDALAYFNLSLALKQDGDAEGAQKALDRARRLNPQIEVPQELCGPLSQSTMDRRFFITLLGSGLLAPNTLQGDHHVISADPLEVEFDLGSLQGTVHVPRRFLCAQPLCGAGERGVPNSENRRRSGETLTLTTRRSIAVSVRGTLPRCWSVRGTASDRRVWSATAPGPVSRSKRL